MSSNNVIYGLPSEELVGPAFAAGRVTLPDGTLDTGYDLGRLCNGNPAKGCRFTTDHLRIVIDHGSPVTCQFPQLTHTNLRSGASARFQRNATNAWGSPAVDVAFTLTNADRAGLRPNPWLNRGTDAATYQFSSLVITGNGVPIVLGQLPCYSALHQLTQNIPDLPVLLPKMSTDILTTGLNAELIAQRSVRQWSLSTPSSLFQTGTSWQEILDWFFDSAGPAQGFGMVWDPSQNDAWFARWDSDTSTQFARRGPAGGVKNAQLGWVEKSRGQVWG